MKGKLGGGGESGRGRESPKHSIIFEDIKVISHVSTEDISKEWMS